jgi:uncharacterized membrane protein YkvA (DUF1232 family)
MPIKITLTLEDSDLKHLREALRAAREVSEKVSEEKVMKGAEELVARIRSRDLPAFVEERISQLALFIEMLRDELWVMPEDVRSKVLTALAYFSEPDDVIPDSVPSLGFLDDAIMIELVLREMRHEIEAYRDFCSFGHRDKEGKGGPPHPVDEAAFRVKRETLRKRIRRRSRADRNRESARGWKIRLW